MHDSMTTILRGYGGVYSTGLSLGLGFQAVSRAKVRVRRLGYADVNPPMVWTELPPNERINDSIIPSCQHRISTQAEVNRRDVVICIRCNL